MLHRIATIANIKSVRYIYITRIQIITTQRMLLKNTKYSVSYAIV